MTIIARLSTLMLAMGLAAAQAQPAGPTSADPPPADLAPDAMPRILNDTREYCEELRADITRLRAARGQVPAEVIMLTREGERMCRIGHIRPGIYRLRTALMMLRNKT